MKLLALALSLFVLVEGCTPTADGAGVDKKAIRRANKKAAGGSGKVKKRRGPVIVGNRVVADSAENTPYLDRAGYVVRGTDVLMFHPCGDSNSYFVVAGGPAMQRIAQRYKFSASRPYSPMYIDLKVRFLRDTVTSGEFVFTRIADVADVNQEIEGKAKVCGPPSRAAIIADSKGGAN